MAAFDAGGHLQRWVLQVGALTESRNQGYDKGKALTFQHGFESGYDRGTSSTHLHKEAHRHALHAPPLRRAHLPICRCAASFWTRAQLRKGVLQL